MANETMQKAPRRYEKMRDSGVEWIGMAPEEWEIFMVGQLTTQVKDKNVALQETNLLSLSYGKIKRKSINTTESLLPASFDNYNIIEAGDVVLRLTDLQNDQTSLRVGLATEKGIITSAYLTIRPQRAVWPNFLYYALHSFDIRKGFYGMGAGVRQGLKFDEVRQIRVVVPSLKAQKSIASYLEKKCNAIDGIVAEVKASIEEYKAWKSSIIYEAVTKGLDPNAEMKDSGVEWIGEIPAHWAFRKMKQVAQFAPKCDFSRIENDAVITFAPMECIRNGYFENRGKQLNTITGSYTPYSEGDIVFAKVTPCFENGNICIMKNLYSGVGLGSSELFVLRARSISTEYLFYYLQHPGFVQRACASMTGTGGLKRVSSDFIQNCPLPIPTEEEQGEIVDFLNRRCTAIEQLISEKSALIEELESYKRSLIYEVVTGKRRVC